MKLRELLKMCGATCAVCVRAIAILQWELTSHGAIAVVVESLTPMIIGHEEVR